MYFLITSFLIFSFSASAATLKFVDQMGEMGNGILIFVGPGSRLEMQNGMSSIAIKRGEEQVKDATFSINGLALKSTEMGDGTFTLGPNINIPNIGPGKTLTLEAKSGADSAKLVVSCPPDFKITSPIEGADYTPGGTVKVAWEGTFKDPEGGGFGPKPSAMSAIWDSSVKMERGAGGFMKPLFLAGKQSGEVQLPSVNIDFQNAPMVKFTIPGELKDGIRCTLVKSVALKVTK